MWMENILKNKKLKMCENICICIFILSNKIIIFEKMLFEREENRYNIPTGVELSENLIDVIVRLLNDFYGFNLSDDDKKYYVRYEYKFFKCQISMKIQIDTKRGPQFYRYDTGKKVKLNPFCIHTDYFEKSCSWLNEEELANELKRKHSKILMASYGSLMTEQWGRRKYLCQDLIRFISEYI